MKIKSLAILAFFLTFASALLSQQGQLDLSFGVNGIVKQSYLPPVPSANEPQTLTLLNDGKFMVAGQHDWSSAFYRFEENGKLDLSFGDSGAVFIERAWLASDVIKGLFVQPDGTGIALMQSTRYNPEILEDWSNCYIMKFNADWEFDDSFGHSTTYAPMGMAEIKTGYDVTDVNSFQLLQDGKMLVSGTVRGSFNSNLHSFVAKLNADGTIDAGFGSNGLAFPIWNDISNNIGSMILQPDGKLILSGSAWITHDSLAYVIARLNMDGSIDSSFGIDGRVAGKLPSANYHVKRIFVLENGSFLAWIGFLYNTLSLDVIRFKPNGDFDTSFGNNGVVHIPNEKTHRVSSILKDDEGSFFLAGGLRDSMHHNRFDFALAKLSPEFNWVDEFGTAGVVVMRDTANEDLLRTATALPNGKILLAGTASPIYYITNMKLVRLFGRDTTVTIDTIENNDTIIPQDSLILNENGLTILPNPVGNDFQICYELAEKSIITIDLFNSVGELLYSFLTKQVREEGQHCEQFAWPKDIIDKGVYFVRLSGRNFAYSAKLLKP